MTERLLDRALIVRRDSRTKNEIMENKTDSAAQSSRSKQPLKESPESKTLRRQKGRRGLPSGIRRRTRLVVPIAERAYSVLLTDGQNRAACEMHAGKPIARDIRQREKRTQVHHENAGSRGETAALNGRRVAETRAATSVRPVHD
jgi:hypothetical protein